MSKMKIEQPSLAYRSVHSRKKRDVKRISASTNGIDNLGCNTSRIFFFPLSLSLFFAIPRLRVSIKESEGVGQRDVRGTSFLLFSRKDPGAVKAGTISYRRFR